MAQRRNPLRLFLGIMLVAVLALTWYLSENRGWHLGVAWIVALNLLAIPVWGYDKFAAGRGWTRIPERMLHTVAAIGAVPASIACMHAFRHKTSKRFFWRLYLALAALHALLLVLWYDPGLLPGK